MKYKEEYLNDLESLKYRLSIKKVMKIIIAVTILFGTLKASSQIITSSDTIYYGENATFSHNFANPLQTKWYFGDGDSSALSTTFHQYTPLSCGNTTYTINLQITDTTNSIHNYSKSIVVKNLPPSPAVTDVDIITPFSNCNNSPSLSNPNFSISFNNSTQDTAFVSYYEVNWGDNSIQTITNDSFPISHTYTQLGLFSFSITAYNAQGCSVTKTYDIANQSNPAIGLSSLGSTQGCAPQEFTFILSQYSSNSPGTYYVWDFGDGSPNVVWNYSAPYINDSIKHTFSSTSCNNSNHAFTVSVTAHNFCDQTTATVSNIRIYTKPTANFSSSADTSCVGTAINLSNYTLSGFGYNCNGNANYQWDFGDGTTSNSTSAIHSYAAGGNYTVKLIATNGVCGSSIDSTQVVINESPDAIASISQSTACDSLILTTNNQSTGGNLIYSWSVSPLSGWHFINGYSANDLNPMIQFDSLGFYTLTLTSTNNCGYDDTSFNITIQGKPQVSLGSISDYCGSANLSPISLVNNNFASITAYDWNFVGATQPSSTIQNPQNISYLNSGTFNVSLKVTNQCGTDSASRNFTIHSLPNIQINAAQNPICFGDSTSLTASGGSQYQWNSNPNIITSQNNTAIVNPSAFSSFVVLGTDAYGCQNTDTMDIIVNSLPNVQISVNKNAFCSGDTLQSICSGALNYTWLSNNNPLGSGNLLNFIPTANGSLVVEGIDNNSCKNTDTISYLVYQRPTITVNNSQPQICVGDSFILTATGANNISISPNQNYNNISNGQYILNPNTNTSYTLTAYDLAGCTSDTSIIVTVHQLPNIQITGNSTAACLNDSLNFQAQGGISYSWYNSNGFTAGNTSIIFPVTQTGNLIVSGTDVFGCTNNDTINVQAYSLPQLSISASTTGICKGDSVTLIGSGAPNLQWFAGSQNLGTQNTLNHTPLSSQTYTLIGTDNNGCNNTATQTINVYNLPTVSYTTTNTQLCQGDSVQLSLSGAGAYYINNQPVNSQPFLSPINSTTFTIKGINGNSCSDTAQLSLTVNPLPSINATTTNNAICLGQSTMLIASGAQTYNWSPSNNLSSAFGDTIIATPNISSNFSVIGTDIHGCKNTASVNITVSNLLNINISASSNSICNGDSVVLSATGANTYQWAQNPNLHSNSGASVVATPNTNSNFIVTGTDSLGCISTQSIAITVHQLPNISINTSNQSICPGDSVVLTAFGGNSYTWSFLQPGNTNYTGNSSQLIDFPNTATTYFVVGTDSNGCSSNNSTTVSILPTPTVAVSANKTALCIGESVNLSATGASTYSWYPQNNISQSTSPTTTSSPIQSQWFIAIGTNAQGCTNKDSIYVKVNPLPTITSIQPSTSICFGDSVTIGVNAIGQVSWLPVAGLSNTFGNTTTTSPNNSTLYIASVLDSNGCSNSTNISVTVNALPQASFNVDTLACLNSNINLQNQSTNGAQFNWDFGDNSNSQLQNPTHSYSQTGYYQTRLIALSSNNCSDTTLAYIHVIDQPQAQFSAFPQTGCSPLNLFLNNNSTSYGGSSNWNFGNGSTSTANNPSSVVLNANAGSDTSYVVYLTTSNKCGTDSYSDTIQVLAKPVSNFGFSLNSLCSPAVATFGNISSSNASSFYWDLGDTTISTMQTPANHTYTAVTTPNSFPVYLVATNQCGADTSMKYVVVNPNYVNAIFTPSLTQACAPATINFTNYSNIQNTAVWNFGDGNVSSQINPNHQYANAGTYNVSLIVTDNCGIDTALSTIVIGAAPTVSFTTTNDTVCQYGNIGLANTTQNLTNLQWILGDSTTSTLASFTHQYQSYGNFNVILIGEDAISHCTDTATKTIVVNPGAKAEIFASNLDGCYPLDVNFQSNSLGASYLLWDFDNGNSAVSQSVTQTFNTPGNYQVSLIANNYYGCSDTTYKIIKAYPRPEALFTTQNTTPCNFPAAIKFTNNSIGASGYAWTFDNNDSSNTKDPLIHYTNPGTFHPKLIAYNTYLCSDTATATLSLSAVPLANFTIDTNEGCAGIDVQFTNSSLDATLYQWSFGNGTGSSLENPLYTYTIDGSYNPYLVAYNSEGCSDTAFLGKAINIWPNPIVDFEWKSLDNGPEEKGKYQFINLSQGANLFVWNFDDGDTSMKINPKHQYLDGNNYDVNLRGYNQYGCSTQLSKKLSVNLLKGLYVPTALAPNNPNQEVRFFTPKGKGLSTYYLAIYDSWGNVIWETSALLDGEPAESWDGTSKGIDVPQGVYYWHAEAVFEDGTLWQGMKLPNGNIITKGSVTLLR